MLDVAPLLDLDRVRHRRLLPGRSAEVAGWPEWLPADCRAGLVRAGMASPWRHQRLAADAMVAGRHVALTTGTASGKTFGYLMAVAAATSGGPEVVAPARGSTASGSAGDLRSRLLRPRRPHTALYLAPTKALAHDQLRVTGTLGLPGWRVAAIDGDSEPAERDWARDHAGYLLTNPDFLHHALLPQHERWSSFLSTLRYVVVDEAHRYRGVFGAQVAVVLRRLRRLCAHYGADPVFVLSSATSGGGDAAVRRSAAALIGEEPADGRADDPGPGGAEPIEVVSADGSPHGAVEVLLWEPEHAPTEDAAELLAGLVDSGRQTVAFIPSRRLAEQVAVRAQRLVELAEGRSEVAAGAGPVGLALGAADGVAGGAAGGAAGRATRRIASYRSGYLAGDRRELEAALQTGAVTGVAATNALELGVDISGLDAVVIAGFPGTRAAFWQQAGRAGRRGTEALVVLVAAANPLDAYLVGHPELLFDHPVEEIVLHPENPYVLGPHLAAAAQELPLTSDDVRWFGPSMPGLVERLEGQGVLRRRPRGWFWAREGRAGAAIDLRSAGGRTVEIVEAGTGRVVGTTDPVNAEGTVHEGAVYLHQGETYLVDEFDRDEGEAVVHRAAPGYVTQARGTHDVRVLGERTSRRIGNGRLVFGDVEVASQVFAYLRRDEQTGTVWDENPLDSPEVRLRTTAVWWTLDHRSLRALDQETEHTLAAGAHAAEHTAIGLLPLFAPCDRWDIGGLSTLVHPDTGQLTVFVHDGHPGGAGFAERGFAVAQEWWTATLDQLRSCPCEAGCPACVVSPKCGNANQMLDKAAATRLLSALLGVPPVG
ncbi:DEAD/DEAH box helicase domain-containing protein [Friedmanniella endophytica]|uniref:DEAD/DEAH box helicase domain-containing protein n=1 Tax=Microlunatus kandeliicorticis TaxID=1759536 RepID=A0A7W3P5J8_9ACTN|nr:DEAD/DEAH box helicase [Microlunatus kandeliicorticis]MBA8794008.1 DEAD/DEAH box helicase domain-containing protein [Microlunatus kandeliicorticis]